MRMGREEEWEGTERGEGGGGRSSSSTSSSGSSDGHNSNSSSISCNSSSSNKLTEKQVIQAVNKSSVSFMNCYNKD